MDEIKILESLPKKEYLMDEEEKQIASIQIVDILFSLLYESRLVFLKTDIIRVLGGEYGPESASTINKISSTCSGFVVADTMNEALKINFERCMCFPLFRSFEIAESTLNDLKRLFEQPIHVMVKLIIKLKQ